MNRWPAILTRRSATTCGCSASCSAKRCAATRAFRTTSGSSGSARWRSGRAAAASGDDFEALAEELRAMPVAAALPVARSFAHFLNLANVAEQHHRVRRRRELEREPGGRPQQASIEEALPRLLGTGRVAGRAVRDDLRPARRAGDHGASDRDHAADAAAQVQPHRRGAGRAGSAGPDADGARGAARVDAPRDCRRLAHRGGPARTAVAARRGPLRHGGVRGDDLERRSRAVPIARPHAAPDRERKPAARRRADPVRLVDWRRSRRQPVRDPRRHEARGADVALDGVDAVRARGRDAPLRAVDDPREPGAAGSRRGRARAVPRGAARSAPAPRGDGPAGRGRADRRGAAGASTPLRSPARKSSRNRCGSATPRCAPSATI